MGNKREQVSGKVAGRKKFLREGEYVKGETDIEEKKVVQSCAELWIRIRSDRSFLASLDPEKQH